MSASQPVICRGKDKHTPIHDNTPIHRCDIHLRSEREHGEDKKRKQESESSEVDRESEPSQ